MAIEAIINDTGLRSVLEAKVDMTGLKRSMKHWAKRFGDTNDETVIRISTSLSRELAFRTQPWGLGKSASKALREAVDKDVRKSVRTVNDSYFSKLVGGKATGVRFRGGWINITPDMLLRSPGEVIQHVDSLRSGNTGKVDKRKVTRRTVKVTSQAILKTAINIKRKRAGLTKGLWLVAGKKAGRYARRKAGISVKTNRWPGSVGEKMPSLATARVKRRPFLPVVELTNRSPMAGMGRFMKSDDIRKATGNAWKKTISQYRAAVRRIDREGRTR